MQQRHDLADIAFGQDRPRSKIILNAGHHHTGGIAEQVALLGNRKGDHLERRSAENLTQARPVGLVVRISGKRLHDGADDGLSDTAVSLERYQRADIVVRPVHFLDNLVIIAFRNDKPAIKDPLVQKLLHHVRLKGAENIPRPKVNPERIGPSGRADFLTVKARERVALRLPFRCILNAVFCQFHVMLLLR